MRLFRRFFPFTTVSGAAWFALRHRRPILDWTRWAITAAPRAVNGEHEDVLAEARIRARLQADDRLVGDLIEVSVDDGRAVIRGEVDKGHRNVVLELAERQKGVEVVDELRERRRSRRRAA
jgi:hypothetical protein